MPVFEFMCKKCGYEWEDLFLGTDPLPKFCPDCKKEGEVKKLISLCSGKVELAGRELTEKLYIDGKKEAAIAATDSNKMANIVGEEKYHQQQLRKDFLKKEKGKS